MQVDRSQSMELNDGSSEVIDASKDISIFEQLDAYPYSADSEFRSGLAAILGATDDEVSREHLTLRAKCFYFARKNGVRIDFDQYKAWRSRQPLSTVESDGAPNETAAAAASHQAEVMLPDTHKGMPWNSEPSAPYPTSFSDIVELISTGQPVSGIKEIPDTVLEGQATQPKAARRQKPWERGAKADV